MYIITGDTTIIQAEQRRNQFAHPADRMSAGYAATWM